MMLKNFFSKLFKKNNIEQELFPERLKIIAIGGRPIYSNMECMLVLANNWESEQSNYCGETFVFLLPINAWNTIVTIKNNHSPWIIDWDDFEEDYVEKSEVGLTNNPYLPKYEDAEEKNTETFVYRHRSIPNSVGEVPLSTTDLSQINDWQYKLSMLKSQYLKSGFSDIESLRDYVRSMADGNSPDFFSWLFDDRSLQGCSVFEIPSYRRSVFELFLQRCKSEPEY